MLLNLYKPFTSYNRWSWWLYMQSIAQVVYLFSIKKQIYFRKYYRLEKYSDSSRRYSRVHMPHNLSQDGRLASEYSFPMYDSMQFLNSIGGALYGCSAWHLVAKASARMIVMTIMRMYVDVLISWVSRFSFMYLTGIILYRWVMYYLKTFASVDSSCDIWFEIVYSAIIIWLDRDLRSVCES